MSKTQLDKEKCDLCPFDAVSHTRAIKCLTILGWIMMLPRQGPLICNKSKLHVFKHKGRRVSLQEEEGKCVKTMCFSGSWLYMEHVFFFPPPPLGTEEGVQIRG